MLQRLLRFEPLESRHLLSITVDTLVDENNGVGLGAGTSLREAIAAAVSGDTIDFSVTGIINLTVGASNSTKHLTVNKNLTINGPGANLLTIKAFDPTPATKNGDGSRVLTIDNGNPATLLDILISGLTLTGGDNSAAGGAILSSENLVVTDSVISGNTTKSSVNDGGGGIHSAGSSSKPNSLTIRGSTLSENTSLQADGGAIRQRNGTVVIENTTISNNSSATGGGALATAGTSNVAVIITGSTLSGNSLTGIFGAADGGAIYANSAKLSITDGAIKDNSAYTGGGIYVLFANGPVNIVNSSITGNKALSGSGGGVFASSTNLSVINSTVSGNTATSNGGGILSGGRNLDLINSTVDGNSARTGGGIYADAGAGFRNLIENTTISGNSATNDMGGIYSRGTTNIRFTTITGNSTPAGRRGALGSWGMGTGQITVLSSIIAGNPGGDIGYLNNPSPFASQGHNLIGTGNNASVASFNQPGDQTNVLDPMLGALADNGGPTKTRVPLPGSPAIDAGDPAAEAGINNVPLSDQRGTPYARVIDGDAAVGIWIDIGAVELQTQPLPVAVYGDYNADGMVDAADYVIWRKSLGTTGMTPFSGADGSGNGSVGQEDITVWRANFGETVAATGGLAKALTSAVSRESSDSVVAVRPALSSALSTSVAAAEHLNQNSDDPPKRMPIASPSLPNAVGSRPNDATHVPHFARGDLRATSRDDALVAWLITTNNLPERLLFEPQTISGEVRTRDATDSCGALDAAFASQVVRAL